MPSSKSVTSKPSLGPIAKYNTAKAYLEDNRIPQMFECLIASLMMDKPDDPFDYLDNQLTEMKEIGIDKVNFDTFIQERHPTKDPVRLELIQDETTMKIKEKREKPVKDESYKPELFELTEPQD